jgi:hypothetical protein
MNMIIFGVGKMGGVRGGRRNNLMLPYKILSCFVVMLIITFNRKSCVAV